ncbi:helix-turn-helix transcriptional regulator [bacterium]|nr:helix-turn-helix transcriptional regulator [bacterium]
MDLKKDFGKRVKELRKKRNFSQEKFSELVDIGQNTLSYIETGKNFCTAETLEKILSTLDIEPNELFSFNHMESNENLLEAINSMLKNNPEKIREVYRIVRAIIN